MTTQALLIWARRNRYIILPGVALLVSIIAISVMNMNERDARRARFTPACLAAGYSEEKCAFFLEVLENAPNDKTASETVINSTAH
jgi:hypothetical protein